MLIIGFGHRARQGKSTAAQAVLDACPLETDVHLYAFADALRMEVRSVAAKFGGQLAMIEQWKAEGFMPDWVTYEEPKPRSLLQWWGTDYRRKQDPDYWVKRLRKKLDAHSPDVAIITDVRFPNELEAIHKWAGVYVEVINTNEPDVAVHGHVSEAALDGVKADFTIRASSPQDCKMQAVEIYLQLEMERAHDKQIPFSRLRDFQRP